MKHDYEKELPDKSRKLIYFKRDKERDFAILSLFLGSGFRVNELSNLRLRDLDFEEKQIHVLRKGGKKDVVAVSPPSIQDIKDYLAVRTERYRGSNDDTAYVFLTRVYDGSYPSFQPRHRGSSKEIYEGLSLINRCRHTNRVIPVGQT